jgi:hypothetical protein
LRDWYARKRLGSYRDQLVRDDVTGGHLRRTLPGE